MRRYSLALPDYSRAIELDPGLVGTITNRGLVHLAMERYEEALADLNQAIELDPGG
jgi:tetratricopeptide (TPR) repeat protein